MSWTSRRAFKSQWVKSRNLKLYSLVFVNVTHWGFNRLITHKFILQIIFRQINYWNEFYGDNNYCVILALLDLEWGKFKTNILSLRKVRLNVWKNPMGYTK